MICALINKVNAGAVAYKKKFCKADYNRKQCIAIVDTDSGQTVPKCKSPENPLCYPQARDLCLTGEPSHAYFVRLRVCVFVCVLV